jgi:hypothetical protein
MSNVYVGYTPNDYYYMDTVGKDYYPTTEECTTLLSIPWGDSSCSAWFSDNSLNCIKQQICLNKNNVSAINSVDASHNSTFGKNINNNEDFQNTFLNTINLGIGILFIIFVIFKIQSTNKIAKKNIFGASSL